jgi:hypothetical protein
MRLVNVKTSQYDVFVGRPSKWGNPFVVDRDGTREQVIRMYEVHLRHSPKLIAALPELVGKVLGCYCAPLPCHGEVLLRLLKERGLE